MVESISIVVPCYNEEETVYIFYKSILNIKKLFENVKIEILFIDDGSKDNTIKVIEELSEKDSIVKYISFSKNFGKEAAIYAGLENARGDFVAIMDVDLQDPPELLYEMYKILINEDYDCVATKRVTRKGEPKIRSFFARCFYKIINKISDLEIVDGARDFRMMKRKMLLSILSLKEYNRFSKGIFSWVGFKTKYIAYENVERVAGKTKWSFFKLFKYSVDGIVAFSTTPLYISSYFGLLTCLISILLMFAIIIRTIIFGDPVSGWPSLVCIIMFFGGMSLFSMGIIGKYLANIYIEVKKRPIYIVNKASKGIYNEN